MLVNKLLRINEKGDTIIEVLVAISVLSLVLAGAFVTTNRSLQGTRDAQDRLNATKLVESQIEQLKDLAANDGSQIFGSSVANPFCIDSSGSVVSSSSSSCTVGINGEPTSNEPAFHLSITRAASTVSDKSYTFTVVNSWAGLRSGNTNTVEMKYRLYE